MAEIDKNLIDPIDEPEAERIHRTMRAALSAVPVLGGPLIECFNALIAPPMERRKKDWMVRVSEAINELYKKGILTEKDLQENEVFFTSLVHASSMAIKNHQVEKLDALRNAVINSALPGAPDEIIQTLFLNFIDSCTLWHLALLRLYQGPENWARERKHEFPKVVLGGLSNIIESAYPEMRGRQEVFRIVWQDLFRYGFFTADWSSGMASFSGLVAKMTTKLGDDFIAYITRPKI